MSYFLEDTKTTGFSVETFTDYSGMNESLFNAEVAWSNIMESAMKTEYMAIRNESQTMLKEGISDFFEKVKEWFKNMFNSIVRVVANIKNKILLKLKYYEKFSIKAAKVLGAKNLTPEKIKKINEKIGDRKLVLFDPQKAKTNYMSVTSACQTAIKKNYSDKDDAKSANEDLEKRYNEFRKEYSKEKELAKKREVVFDKKLVDNALFLNDILKSSTQSLKTVLSIYEKAKKECQIGIKYADKEDKEDVLASKAKVVVINRAGSIHLNVSMIRFSDIKNYVSKVMALKGSEKDEESKLNKEYKNYTTAKKESYFGF